jgi:hypothetical protein
LTIPRLRELVAAYEQRYHRHLHDVGVATAIAHHDPQGLEKAFATRPREDERYDKTKRWW